MFSPNAEVQIGTETPGSYCTCRLIVCRLPFFQGLFLKPIARLNISVQLPHLTEPGKTISNWEVMEKMKGMAKPDSFTMIKVAKSTMDFVRFEAEVEVR